MESLLDCVPRVNTAFTRPAANMAGCDLFRHENGVTVLTLATGKGRGYREKVYYVEEVPSAIGSRAFRLTPGVLDKLANGEAEYTVLLNVLAIPPMADTSRTTERSPVTDRAVSRPGVGSASRGRIARWVSRYDRRQGPAGSSHCTVIRRDFYGSVIARPEHRRGQPPPFPPANALGRIIHGFRKNAARTPCFSQYQVATGVAWQRSV
jgi:hypothetical protein